MGISARKIAFAAASAAAYAALTVLLAPISYGAVQFRVSEALCILPFFVPCAAWGLFVGCAAANLISAAGPLDVIFGSLATLLASLCISAIGKRSGKTGDGAKTPLPRLILVCALPVIFNGPVIGAVIAYTAAPEIFWQSFVLFGAQVALGEAVVMFALGLPLLKYLPRVSAFTEQAEKFC